MRTVRLVARREIRERLRSKSFLGSTVLTLAIILAVAVLPSLIADDGPTTYDVGVIGSEADADDLQAALEEVVAAMPEDDRVEIDVVAYPDEAAARSALEDGDADAIVATGGEVLVQEDLPDTLGAILQLARAGAAPPPLEVRAIDPPDPDSTEREGLVFAGTVLLYGQLLGFGYWVAGGIVEEKTSRVVEVLLAKARPNHLVAGKVIGIGTLGFVQLVAFMTIGLATAAAVGTVELPASTIRAAFEVLAWFVLGYAFYSSLFAVGGALASRPEELQNTTGPAIYLAVGSFMVAIFAGSDPGGTLARVATFFPPSAPLVLPIRSAAGELALWEAVVSVSLVVVSIVVVVRLAARVYGGAALHTRGQLKLREAMSRTS